MTSLKWLKLKPGIQLFEKIKVNKKKSCINEFSIKINSKLDMLNFYNLLPCLKDNS
jgi:hypothetical protein